MATWYDTTALDALLDTISGQVSGNGATTVRLLDTYAQGDTWDTVNSNTIAEAAITSGDFTGPADFGNHRRLTFSGKQGAATANSSIGALHIALCSATVVLAVTDETSNQPITNLNPVTFPSFYMQSSQPTQV